MARLMIIADDLTGALDSAVQFTEKGAAVRVLTADCGEFPEADVLVVNAETRHVPPPDAYAQVFAFVKKAVAHGVPWIYKKTDSGLRGKIGSERAAVMDASGCDVMPFIPAFPKLGRVTRNGIHYMNGVPVAESSFGADPFEPVRESDIRQLLGLQTDHKTYLNVYEPTEPGIHIYDAERDEDLRRIAETLSADGLHISGGCAGFGAALAELLGFCGQRKTHWETPENLFVVCGSVHPVMISQLVFAAEHGAKRISIPPEQLLTGISDQLRDEVLTLAKQEGCCILDAAPEHADRVKQYARSTGMEEDMLRETIACTLGTAVKDLLAHGLHSTMLCSGGDTLLGMMRALGVTELEPVQELLPGIVLTRFGYGGKHCHVISKSGGFGGIQTIVQIANILKNRTGGANRVGML